jgi:hypothetical protein
MACDFMRQPNQTQPQRAEQIESALDRLNKALAIGEVKIKVGPTGSITFLGADAILKANGIADTCAYRKLLAQGSPALRQALAKAEALAGRKVDPRAVAAGTHSHDGGKTWHKGH